ncbi:VC2046/SO_2500 family protein [Idiomarina sp. HP20-50]|uniref:VC2046/SO_2500 family protein n=1 Tax=Idiomarina sp. HP20-50 TaxID=3070813 RepID=UPI00294B7DDC|nr:VC2046/SO_2500 family protein [Idiomarina sp. HP20-50]MDV6315360.1 VC2046/SO_2500 family protein [Idiomarina sp. HP20-50]
MSQVAAVQNNAAYFFEQHASEAVNHGFAGEFAYWVSALGADPVISERSTDINWQRAIGAGRARPLDVQPGVVLASGVYANISQLSDFKLQDATHPQPLIPDATPGRLPLELLQNLDWRVRQRLDKKKQPQAEEKDEYKHKGPAGLYDVLQKLGITH